MQTPHYLEYSKWAASGMAAGMGYLHGERVHSLRQDPPRILNDAQSVMVLGLHYRPVRAENTIPADPRQPVGKIASYACYDDYHFILRDLCSELIDFINTNIPKPIKHRVFIDSGPVMEKDFTYLAGLGWIGKNSLFIHPMAGSYCVLACIFSDHPFRTDEPLSTDPCGECQVCINACPTQCITQNRSVDARRCIAYLTIETRGTIARELREKIGSWIFGCDVCQQVCPLNQEVLNTYKKPSTVFQKRISGDLDIQAELNVSPGGFQDKYQSTPVIRATYSGFLRNLITSAGNSQTGLLVEPISRILFTHPSPVIRTHAAWSVGKIAAKTSRKILSQALTSENDASVRQEIQLSLNSFKQ